MEKHEDKHNATIDLDDDDNEHQVMAARGALHQTWLPTRSQKDHKERN